MTKSDYVNVKLVESVEGSEKNEQLLLSVLRFLYDWINKTAPEAQHFHH